MASRSKPKKLDSEGLWNYALRVLGKRAHSTFELKRKLALRAENPSLVAETVSKLREYGFADDEKFSESFAASRLQNDGFGRLRTLRDLQAKRVPGAIASNVVEKTYSGTDENALIDEFLKRKYRGKNLAEFLKEQKHVASVYRRLRTGGFSTRASIEALKRHAVQLEDWEPDPEEESNSEPD